MTSMTRMLAIAQMVAVMMGLAAGQYQTYTSANGAQVNYYQQNLGSSYSQMMVMQVQQTTTVTYIASPLTSALSQFVINNPRGLVYASQRANQRMQDLALQAFSFKRIGLDNKKSGSTSGRHTIFIGTKPASMALMDDKTLIDFLLEEIFKAMGFSLQQQSQTMNDVIVYNKQGISNPSTPVFTRVTPPPKTAPTAQARPNNPLTCQNSVDMVCDPKDRFRTADGTCNNLKHNLWGSALIPLRRYLSPAYDDGVSVPRTLSVLGGSLPSARYISTTLHPSGQEARVTSLTHMLMQWGQFIDHDITSTPIQTASDGSALTCCEDEMPIGTRGFVDVENRTACFPIPIPPTDPFFIGRKCFSFPRSVQVTNADCQQIPVEQLNQITSYIDASQVYGSSLEEQNKLRSFKQGKLKTSSDDLLPKDSHDTCVLTNPNRDFCFKAGDLRVNEQMALTSMHTVWMRQHNRLASQLAIINPHWDDERLFKVARKIVGGLLQKITYGDWLPLVLSSDRLSSYGLQPLPSGRQSNFYDPNTDATVRNVFATAAFRFGHSLIRSTMSQLTHLYQDAGRWRLEQSFGNTSQILQSKGLGVDMYMRGMLRDQPNMVDRFFTGEVQNNLFQDQTGNSLDLVAFNIQRGRDHGLPSYNDWRRYCGLRVITSFDFMPDHDPFTSRSFAAVYKHPDDIDMFSGGISELPEGGGLVGPTFACILSQQFSDIKYGDRFWFETNDRYTGFTRAQLDQIRKHTLSRVLCDVTSITQIQPNPFRQVSFGNPLMNCQDLPEMNLMLWKEGSSTLTPQTSWGMWGSWSQCLDGIQMRVRSCSQGGREGVCGGPGQDTRGCSDVGWTSQWSQWSDWFGCMQGYQRRTRVCQGFSDPCPGGPEEIRLCRGPDTSTRNSNPTPFSYSGDQGPPGWAQWAPWQRDCQHGKQRRTRTCNKSYVKLGACSGPSSQSRDCDNADSGYGGYLHNFRFIV